MCGVQMHEISGAWNEGVGKDAEQETEEDCEY
jgi:hypothetical protein